MDDVTKWVTLVLSILGAGLSLWNFFLGIHKEKKILKIEATLMDFYSLHPGDGDVEREKQSVVLLQIINCGRRSVFLKAIGGEYNQKKKRRFWISPMQCGVPQFPFELKEGGMHQFQLSEDFVEAIFIENDVRHLHVCDTTGQEWIFKGRKLAKLKSDIRDWKSTSKQPYLSR